MIPFLAVKSFLGRIPRAAWIALAVVAILLLGTCVHQKKVKKFGQERYAAGVAYEQARLAKKAAELKAKVDALTGKITTQLKAKHDEKVIVINRAADDLRVRGPGKAACPGHSSVPRGSSGSVSAGGGGNPATGQVPGGDRAAVPFGWLVDSAERCDLNRQEVLTWREWYKQQSEAWKKFETDSR